MLQAEQGFAQFLREFAMRRKVNFFVLKNELVNKSLEQIINVVAAEVRVAVGGEHLIDVAGAGGDELEDGNIKRAAAEIVDGDFAALCFMQAVGERRGSRLVDEPQNFQAGNLAGILRGLTLRIVKIRRYCDDRAVDGFTKMGLSPVFQFAQNERRNFQRSENFVAENHADDVLA